LTESSRQKSGRAARTAVLGEAYVARSDAKRSAFNADFLDFITEGAWGSVWSRPGLTKRERSLITLALLAALGHHEELVLHVRATANTGATADDIKEALLHVAVYAGVPAANQAFKVAEETLKEMGRDNAAADEESRS
jgi:4-carboxymuconolactone decarboxylase